jgi:hypothetical protein
MSSKQSEGGTVDPHASGDGGVLSGAVEQLDRELMTFDLVEERLAEAWGFMLRLPDRERGWQRVTAIWPEVRRHNFFGDYGGTDPDARPRQPGLRTAEVERMEEALGWVDWVAPQHRTLLGLVLSVLQKIDDPDWIWIAARVDGKPEPSACRMRYSRSITRICERLNGAEIGGVEGVKG